MIRGWRIVKSKHKDDAFSGEGARLYGGRWNSPGTAVVYAAESESLAVLELLVHLDATEMLGSYSVIPVEFAEELVQTVDPSELPEDWRRYPSPVENKALGDVWVSTQESLVLALPSAVVDSERIFLINPEHRDFSQLVIGQARPFALDERLRSQ